VSGECLHTLKGLESGTASIAFSPLGLGKGKLGCIAAGGWSGQLIIWDVEVGGEGSSPDHDHSSNTTRLHRSHRAPLNVSNCFSLVASAPSLLPCASPPVASSIRSYVVSTADQISRTSILPAPVSFTDPSLTSRRPERSSRNMSSRTTDRMRGVAVPSFARWRGERTGRSSRWARSTKWS
jgi:hypothetical protein